MGNEISTSALDRDPRDWEGVLSEEWRSDRIRELDRLGGKLCYMPGSQSLGVGSAGRARGRGFASLTSLVIGLNLQA